MKKVRRYLPSLEDFRLKAKKGNLIPVYREILADLETPVSAFLKIQDSPYCYLLESVEGGEQWARYSFLGCSPSTVIIGNRDNIKILQGRKETILSGEKNPLAVLRKHLSKFRPVAVKGLPRFCGGAVGYLSYEMARYFEKLPDRNKSALTVPDFLFVINDSIIIFDNLSHKIKVVSNAYINSKKPDVAYREAVRKIEKLISQLKKNIGRPTRHRRPSGVRKTAVKSNLNENQFKKMVIQAKEYIKAGDIIQVVLSQRFERPIKSLPFDIYRALRAINPSPYMYYLQLGELQIVGSSPEVMVRLEDDQVELRPIAGTRRRGESEAEDKMMENELLRDEKERAEHIMLVDLGRNDLGRISKIGRVKVNQLMAVERYSHVMHLVSHVSGLLESGRDSFDVMQACFPAGTVSGAPKIRAMEIIEELEPGRRGPYAGAVGYFGFSGNMDTCINIRSITVTGRRAYVQVGAGIVADSDPKLEYKETIIKGEAMLAAIETAEAGLD